MAAFIYLTPDNWKPIEGNTRSAVDPKEALLLEIYNQMYLLVAAVGAAPGSSNFFFAPDGTSTYQNNSLIGKTIDSLFSDGVLQTPTVDYTFDSTTGTITWLNIPSLGANACVQFHTT